ncbi:MAG TPA: hypothetical protein ENI33_04335 [Thermoplasmatales archaeon]|nr:hypothetical protein [Thermoplasmatales archaeon]
MPYVIYDNDANDLDNTAGNISVTVYFNEECNHTLEWWSVDYVGNEGEHNSTYFMVDNTPPNISKEYGTPYYKNTTGAEYITSLTPIYINATDNRSAPCIVGSVHVNVSIYSFLTEQWTYHEWHNWSDDAIINKTIYLPEECKHWINITAWDDLNNTVWLNQTVYVDNTPPNISKEYGTPYYKNTTGAEYITSLTPIYINATDNRSAPCIVGSVHVNVSIYSFLTEQWTYHEWHNWSDDAIINKTIYLPEECKHWINITAWDDLNNTVWLNQTVYVDNTPPIATVDAISPYCQEINETNPLTITVTAIDYTEPCVSGVKNLNLPVSRLKRDIGFANISL